MSTFAFDKEKYMRIVKSEGVPAALTRLQADTMAWEHQAFEGKAGYDPVMWEELHKVREFSRALWELALRMEPSPAKPLS
jgi:hypothetical protein